MRSNKLRFMLLASVALLLSGIIIFESADKVSANSTVDIALKNNTKAFEGTTLGMGGTVMPFGYHSSWKVKDFNDDDLAVLMTQFKKTGSTVARLWLDGAWWEPTNDNADPDVMLDSGFTWNSIEMNSLYKYLQAFKDMNVDVFVDVMVDDPRVMYPWLTAEYASNTGPNTGMVPEYAEHIAAMVKHLVVTKGFTNVKYVSFSGEPNNFFLTPPGVSKLKSYKESMTAVRSRLQSENLLQYVKLIGPEIGYSDHDTADWLDDLSTNISASLDAYTIHSGQTKAEATDGTYVSLIKSYIDIIKANDPNGADKPIMITDYTPTGTIRRAEDGLNSVALIANGLRAGVSEFGRWSFADDIWTWPSGSNQTSTSFGDYGFGIIGSKQENFTPRPNYKATALAYKLIPKGSTAYQATTTNEAIIPAIIQTAEGKHTIIVVNWSNNDADVNFTLEDSIHTTFRKYKFESASIDLVDKFGEIPASFGTKSISGTSFTDTIPANTIYYYSDIPDQTAPAQVTGLNAAAPDFHQASITWTAGGEADLSYYRIYRSDTSAFTPAPGNKVGEIWIKPGGAPSFHDRTVEQGKTYYYKVSAVDGSENEGPASAYASVQVGDEAYSDTLSVINSTDYDYYEIDSDFANGYKVRVYKKAGVIGFLQDKQGYSRQNLGLDFYSTPMVLKYNNSAFTDKVQNGGAEDGTTAPDNWYSWNNANGSFTWDASVRHSGSRSLKITNANQSANSTWYQQTTDFIPGKHYEVSYWIKTDQVDGPNGAGRGAYLNIQFFDANGVSLGARGGADAYSNVGTQDWTYFVSDVTVPYGTATVQIGGYLYENSGTVWFDDIRFVEKPDVSIVGQSGMSYEADSVTFSDISSTHKRIVTVLGDETLYYDFYTDRIEIKVQGPNAGGYFIEDGGIVPRNVTSAYWSDGSEDVMSDTFPGEFVTKNATSLSLYQPPASQMIRYEFGSAKSMTLQNGGRFRGYYPRFQIDSNEVFTMKFPRKSDNPNGGAENGTTSPDDWTTWNQSSSGTFAWDSSTRHWGNKSLKITNATTDHSAWIAQMNAPVSLTKTLQLSAWIKTLSVAGTQGAFISVEAKDSAHNVLATYRIPFVSGTNDWKKYTLSFNPPAGTAYLYIVGNLYSASGTVWFDDFELFAADTGISNAGMEIGTGGPTGWSSWTSSGMPFAWDDSTYYQGKKSLKITNNANQYSAWHTSRSNLQVSKEFEFGGWIKTSGVATGAMGAQLQAIAMDSNGQWLQANVSTTVLHGTNDWTYVRGKITLPPLAASVQLQAQLWGVNGTAWFDDLFLRLVDKS
ncbi:carbohydrate binding domain-containing protein [Paenibacillus sp. J5C_2022]|uniref:carbohydrate binding domain-containing protein n=1 Tax=Paenibacillus sp. J5C2022 TaxID=2977129 RepID=UPI0021CFD528|nr:carbohydrate binding domain-containing protein [Paenibacillus sp. J5C2022]MCU6709673.1 carbohydrate binding domain-containing protein [Paenibacillus sp. J5C2022]